MLFPCHQMDEGSFKFQELFEVIFHVFIEDIFSCDSHLRGFSVFCVLENYGNFAGKVLHVR